ncbi:hypothetical protein [Bradyrhizobium sp. ORS 375]|uniref:hypothetical protein n=1 Tax=Bradyrhizobium sp. (strain ORS 375) TaxID=566679 RepID=UPI0011128866|nr:hypothetical protein [Bradyrhizobium sp. ORS 375]
MNSVKAKEKYCRRVRIPARKSEPSDGVGPLSFSRIIKCGGLYHQLAEVDRRPWQPRQLAGEYGCSERGEESFEVGELPVEGILVADSDAVRSCEAPDDSVNADHPAADAAFKPKCLRISSSINVSPTHAERSPSIRSEHVPAAQARGLAGLPTSQR